MKKELGAVEVAVKVAVEIGLVQGIVARSQLIVCFMKEIRIFDLRCMLGCKDFDEKRFCTVG